MNSDSAAHHIVFSMLCDSLSTGNDESNVGSLAMMSDTTKSLQEEQYGESLCSDNSLGISIRKNPLYGIDIHETESPGLITGVEFPIVESVSKHHVLDSLRKSLPDSPLREPLNKKQENIDPTRISVGIDSKGMTERKYDGAANYWQERAKYEEIRARLVCLRSHYTHDKYNYILVDISVPICGVTQVSWDLAQERRHSEDRLAEERRKSARLVMVLLW